MLQGLLPSGLSLRAIQDGNQAEPQLDLVKLDSILQAITGALCLLLHGTDYRCMPVLHEW